MAVIVQFTVFGMSVEKYETALRRLEAAGVGAPAGRLHHMSYGDRDCLQFIDVFDSPHTLDEFGTTMLPILKELGVTVQSVTYPAYKIIKK